MKILPKILFNKVVILSVVEVIESQEIEDFKMRVFGSTSKPEKIKIKVVGCGGAGCNALSIINKYGLDAIAINDFFSLSASDIEEKILIKKEEMKTIALTDDRLVKTSSPIEEEIEHALSGADMIFILCGLGGQVGSYTSQVVAKIGKKTGAVVLTLVILPFKAESEVRSKLAVHALSNLRSKVDALVHFSNDDLLKIAPNAPIIRAFDILNEIMVELILDISRIVTKSDLPYLKDLGKEGSNLFIGTAEDFEKNKFLAVEKIIGFLRTKMDVENASNAMIFIKGDAIMKDAEEIVKDIQNRIDKDAKIMYGLIYDMNLKYKIKISVILGKK
jgi:cell division protein FtsZ